MPETVTDQTGNPLKGRMPARPVGCTIRAAIPSDVPAILGVIASLSMARESASEKGFLRQRHTTADYERFAAQGHVKIAALQGQPIGYLLSFPWNSAELQFERQATTIVKWTGESYADSNHPVLLNAFYIAEIGIEPRLARQGFGRSLYGEILEEHRSMNAIATTIEAPLLNRAAAAFHEALGFQRVGFFAIPEFYGLTPYQSGVYLRQSVKG